MSSTPMTRMQFTLIKQAKAAREAELLRQAKGPYGSYGEEVRAEYRLADAACLVRDLLDGTRAIAAGATECTEDIHF